MKLKRLLSMVMLAGAVLIATPGVASATTAAHLTPTVGTMVAHPDGGWLEPHAE